MTPRGRAPLCPRHYWSHCDSVTRTRRPLPGKAAVIADIIWRRKLTRTGHSLNRRYSIASLGLLGAFLFLIPIDRSASSYQLLNLSFAGFFLDRLFSIAELLSFEGALAPSVFDNSPLLLIDPILRSFDDLVGAAEQTLLNLQSVGVSVLHL